jgi:hypothetical protein
MHQMEAARRSSKCPAGGKLRSLTAKDTKDAKENNSLAAKAAKDVKGTIIRTNEVTPAKITRRSNP